MKNIKYRMRMLIPKHIYAQITYFLKCRKFLNLKKPKTVDEKLWWLKFNYFNPLMTQLSDKWEVRKYVKDCGFEDILIPNYGHWYSVDDIKDEDIAKIPEEKFFIKVNNTSGGNLICQKNTFNKENIRKEFTRLLNDNFYWHGREYNYKNIKPCIIAEKVLETKDDVGLLDYKFLCFNGKPKLLFMDIGVAKKDGTHAEEYYRNIYDTDFNPVLDVKETRDYLDYNKIPKPENWDYMIEICKKLSSPFPHCRVDLYNIDGHVYFGEITFFHGSGYNDFQPKEADLKIGSWIKLDKSFPNKY